MTQGFDPLRFVARVTIEARSPCIIASGQPEHDVDRVFMRDINGLPMIPGTSLAGILSSLFEETNYAEEFVDSVFGTRFDNESSKGSRLKVSDGVFHNAKNTPVPQTPDRPIVEDSVTEFGRKGIRRDHVRINARGVSDGRGKFDERLCPKGARFTFELELPWGSPLHGEPSGTGDLEMGRIVWESILSLPASPHFLVGASSRSGLGRIEVCEIAAGAYWLPAEEEWEGFTRPEFATGSFQDFTALPTQMEASASHSLRQTNIPVCAETTTRMVPVTLQKFCPEDTWFHGGGIPMEGEDVAPLSEAAITWDSDTGDCGIKGKVLDAVFLIPGSSFKGALSHRVMWHLNRMLGNYLGSGFEQSIATELHDILFGSSKERDDAEPMGRAGRLFVSDIYFADSRRSDFTHVALDRFHGGARAGLLFNEAPRFGARAQDVTLLVDVSQDLEAESGLPELLADALFHALRDLSMGWLALGAAGGRGHGTFECSLNEKEFVELKSFFSAALPDPETEGAGA